MNDSLLLEEMGEYRSFIAYWMERVPGFDPSGLEALERASWLDFSRKCYALDSGL